MEPKFGKKAVWKLPNLCIHSYAISGIIEVAAMRSTLPNLSYWVPFSVIHVLVLTRVINA